MTSHRIERVNALFREEISQLIFREMRSPDLKGLISVTEVDTTADLRHARVFISVMAANDAERDLTFATLKKAEGFFRRALSERLRMYRIPEIEVVHDESIERGARVMSLLKEIEREDEKPDGDQ